MKEFASTLSLPMVILLLSLVSCNSTEADKIQGVFSADKESLKDYLEDKLGRDNSMAIDFVDRVIKSTIIELKITADSIHGLVSFDGETSSVHRKIHMRNDTLVLKSANTETYFVSTKNGVVFKNKNAGNTLKLLKSDHDDFSPETKEALRRLGERN